jgi:hypothetical protein
MKTIVTLITLTAALLLPAGTAATAQPAPTPAEPPRPREATDKVRLDMQDAQRQLENAREQLERLQKQLQQDAPRYGDRLRTIVTHAASGGSGGVLVIRSGDTDTGTQADLEEDLAVMSRVFDKALEEEFEKTDRGRTVMGIDVLFTPGPNPVRSLYLEGYGVLFAFNVKFPLLAPPSKTEEPQEKPSADSSWEEARREVHGQPQGFRQAPGVFEPFDGGKVDKLKAVLLEALKSAANIRRLKADDSITVCIFGAGAPPIRFRQLKTKTTTGVPLDFEAEKMTVDTEAGEVFLQHGAVLPSTQNRGTIMTLRAKKSDVDAFAAGKLGAEEFQKRVDIAVYAGNTGGGGFASGVFRW